MCQRSQGLVGVWGYGWCSVGNLEDGRNGVREVVEDQSWIRQGSQQLNKPSKPLSFIPRPSEIKGQALFMGTTSKLKPSPF